MIMLYIIAFFTIISQVLSFSPHSVFGYSSTRNVKRLSMAAIEDSDKNSVLLGVTGVGANIVCDYSLYVLKSTGCGLPPGPFGLEGALEGISYLGIIGILIWSLQSKIQTGSGLPAGKYGLLGLAEGLTFLTVLGGIIIAGLNLSEYGFLPGFLPNDNCYGIND